MSRLHRVRTLHYVKSPLARRPHLVSVVSGARAAPLKLSRRDLVYGSCGRHTLKQTNHRSHRNTLTSGSSPCRLRKRAIRAPPHLPHKGGISPLSRKNVIDVRVPVGEQSGPAGIDLAWIGSGKTAAPLPYRARSNPNLVCNSRAVSVGLSKG